MKMNEKFIAPSREKLTKNIRMAVWYFVLSLVINGAIYYYFYTIHVVLWIASIVLFCMIPYSIRELFRPEEKRGLLLTAHGLIYKQTVLGRSVWEIKREDIDQFVLGKFDGSDPNQSTFRESECPDWVCLIFKDPEPYIKALGNWKLKKDMAKTLRKTGVPLSTNELDITAEDLYTWLNSYLKQYAKKSKE